MAIQSRGRKAIEAYHVQEDERLHRDAWLLLF